MNKEQVLDEMKPILPSLIEYFYSQPNNSTGGWLHIVLDDGNVDVCHIEWCKEEATKIGDSLAVLIADLLLRFETSQLERLYKNNWEFDASPRSWKDITEAIWGDDEILGD